MICGVLGVDPTFGSPCDPVVLGLFAAAVAVIAATISGWAAGAALGLGLRPCPGLATVGYAVPGTVVAVAVYVPLVGFDRGAAHSAQDVLGLDTGLIFTGTILGLLVAYLVRFLALAYFAVEARMNQISPSLDDATRVLGPTAPASSPTSTSHCSGRACSPAACSCWSRSWRSSPPPHCSDRSAATPSPSSSGMPPRTHGSMPPPSRAAHRARRPVPVVRARPTPRREGWGWRPIGSEGGPRRTTPLRQSARVGWTTLRCSSAMPLGLVALCVDANDPLGFTRFWSHALGWEVADDASAEVALVPTDGTRFPLDLLPAPTPSTAQPSPPRSDDHVPR